MRCMGAVFNDSNHVGAGGGASTAKRLPWSAAMVLTSAHGRLRQSTNDSEQYPRVPSRHRRGGLTTHLAQRLEG